MNKPDLSVNIAGVYFKNPVITASGTFGFGREYAELFDLSKLGGITVKGMFLKKCLGNPPPRIAETASGVLNSVGLQNPGVNVYLKEELPFLKQFNTVIIANISGNTIKEYCEMAEKISDSDTDMIEMNISCPNIKEGGIAFGVDPDMVEDITARVKKHCKKPLIVKLSPNVTNIALMAKRAEEGGADVISLINTLLGMKIDINKRKPILYNNMGGLSGPAIMPIAVRMCYQVKNAVKIPIIGMGGISSGDDALEFILAGATGVAVGTAIFSDPYAPLSVIDGIEKYMIKYNIPSLDHLIGKVCCN